MCAWTTSRAVVSPSRIAFARAVALRSVSAGEGAAMAMSGITTHSSARARGSGGGSASSAVEYRPADVVAQPLVVEDEVVDRVRKLVTLPPALQSPRPVAVAFGCGSARGLDRVGGRSELVRGDVRD